MTEAPRKKPTLTTQLALAGIRLYQRYLSPVKGFSCAYRVLTGGDSCSAYGYRVIARHGLMLGTSLLRRRLQACGEQHRQHLARQAAPRRMTARHRAQAGDCACDVPHADCISCDRACDVADLMSGCHCDFSSWKKKGPSWDTGPSLKRQQQEHQKKIHEN